MRLGRHGGNARLGVLLGLIVACFLMGGASRADSASLLLLQPLAVLATMAFLLIPGPRDWAAVRVPLLLAGALGAIMAAQLVPLPPSLWSQLPGRGELARDLATVGAADGWRPISLTPDLTLGSLVGLVVPLAVLVGVASIEPHRRRVLLLALIAGALASALVGMAQVSGGSQSPFYLYKVTNIGAAVGLFANRNHQAVLLAMTWPMLVAWAMAPGKNPQRKAAERWIAAALGVLLVPMLLVTGSRAGLLLGAVSLVAAGLIGWRSKGSDPAPRSRFERWLLPLGGMAAVLVLVATIFLSRALALQRVLSTGISDKTRFGVTPTLLDMTRDFFPVGSGFGSFDPLFRYYEPLKLVDQGYLNHAHNDWLELAITGGLPALAIGLVFLGWSASRTFTAWRSKEAGFEALLARLASVMIALPLASSVVDYPLRTPLMMAVVAVACAWLDPPRQGVGRPAGG